MAKEIEVTVVFCDESELTEEEKARMEAAQRILDRQVEELIGKLVMERRMKNA